MKLLFDENLSFHLCDLLSDVFPGSQNVRRAGLERADDLTLWRYAKAQDYALVTFDADFAELAALFGAPPKIIWLRSGNRPTAQVAALLRQHRQTLEAFESDAAACLELY